MTTATITVGHWLANVKIQTTTLAESRELIKLIKVVLPWVGVLIAIGIGFYFLT